MLLLGLSEKEKIREVEFRASCCLAGRFSVDFEEGKIKEYGIYEQKSSILVSYSADEAAASDGTFPVYFLSFPTPDGTGCGNFAVRVVTDKYIYNKTVSGKMLEFKLNTITKFKMDLSSASKEAVSYSEGNPYARGHQIPNADRNADADVSGPDRAMDWIRLLREPAKVILH